MPISIDGSGSITGVSSLSNPSEIVVGTGVSITSPSANELSIRTNDAERIRVGAGGSVGIGTDNPDSKLHIRDLDSTITLEATRGSGHKYRIETTGLNAEGINIYDNATNQRAWLYYAGTDPSTDSYHTFNTNGTERVRIDHGGRVRMPYQPMFYAYRTTAVSTSSTGIFNSTQWNATLVNVGNHFNTSNGRFTAPIAGKYVFYGKGLVRWTNSPGSIETTLYKNGSNVVTRGLAYDYMVSTNDHATQFFMVYLDLAAGDFIQYGVVALTIGTDLFYGENLGSFSGQLIG